MKTILLPVLIFFISSAVAQTSIKKYPDSSNIKILNRHCTSALTKPANKIHFNLETGMMACCCIPSSKIGFYITKSDIQTIMPHSFQQVNFDTELYDDADAFNSNCFTVPEDGVYHFDIKLLYNLNSTKVRYAQILGFFVEGEEVTRTHHLVEPGINAHKTIELSLDYKLYKGETVAIYTYQDSNISQAIIPNYNFFSGHRVY